MKRRTPLRADPDATPEWIERSRRKQIEAQKRGFGMKRSPIRKRNPDRKAREFARCYGSEARVRVIKALPCSVPGCWRCPCENAHVEGGGMGRKAGWESVVSLCRYHHEAHHWFGSTEAFDKYYGTDLKARAAVLAEMILADGEAS